jgi:hypothetical protein
VDALEAVEALELTGRKHSTAVRCVGYAILIQELGWDGVEGQMGEKALGGLRHAYREAGLDPLEINYADGQEEYLREVMRSSVHHSSKIAGKDLLDRDL